MTESELFKGHSVPRNKELIRVFRDFVEHLGYSIPRILRSYGKRVFQVYGKPFVNDTLYIRTSQKTIQVLSNNTWSTNEIRQSLGLKNRPTFLYDYIKPALENNSPLTLSLFV